jgi:HEPN domain-containing protein
MGIDRTSSMGLWRYANEFYETAVLTRKEKGDFYIPSYYLICHSIELALKAFLRGAGKDLDFLKYDLGHDLEKSFSQAKNNCLTDYATITKEFETSMKMVSLYYKNKGFEYITTGTKTLPNIDILIEGTSSLISEVRAFCIKKRELHYK